MSMPGNILKQLFFGVSKEFNVVAGIHKHYISTSKLYKQFIQYNLSLHGTSLGWRSQNLRIFDKCK